MHFSAWASSQQCRTCAESKSRRGNESPTGHRTVTNGCGSFEIPAYQRRKVHGPDKCSRVPDRGEVHLNVTAEIKQGLLRCELIDPTGAVRTKIGTTEHASMNTNDMKAIKGEWLLRLTLEDATGKYQVHWVE
jgi:hypothetical protein